MIAHQKNVKWSVRVMSPHDLSRGMLRRNPYNLCACQWSLGSVLMLDV